jgi:hypothetical protein
MTTEKKKPTTRRDKLRLVHSAVEIIEKLPEVGDKAFAPRLLALTTFPHRQPKGNPPAWTRKNGRAFLTIRPGWDAKKNKQLPYPAGSIPRLLTVWLCREAIRAEARGDKSGRFDLGHSLTSFMLELGLNPSNGSSGAKRSDARRLREGMIAFFQSIISYHEDLTGPDRRGIAWDNMQVAPRGVMFWDEKTPDQGVLWGSWIQTSPEFREALVASAIPLDLRALRALKASPLAIDLYIWLCHESNKAKRTGKGRFVSWDCLMEQFGTGYADIKNFGREARVALRKVQLVYPGLKLGSLRGGVSIAPDTKQAIEPREPTILEGECKTL